MVCTFPSFIPQEQVFKSWVPLANFALAVGPSSVESVQNLQTKVGVQVGTFRFLEGLVAEDLQPLHSLVSVTSFYAFKFSLVVQCN